jgi:hypothetical protein
VPLPEPLKDPVAEFVGRSDYAYLDYVVREDGSSEWAAAVYTGERREDGAPKRRHFFAPRLSVLLDKMREIPVHPRLPKLAAPAPRAA